MEENTSLFSLSIDIAVKSHLYEAAKWAKFLAIIGMILLALVLAKNLYTFYLISQYSAVDSMLGQPRGIGSALTIGTIAGTLLVVVIPFFSLLFVLRFANGIKSALDASDQAFLNSALQNLKLYFRYLGIISALVLVVITITWVLRLGTSIA